jgi:hypothetical protein
MTTLQQMTEVVISHGPAFSGGDEESTSRVANEWIDEGFSPKSANLWMNAGFSEPSVAAKCRDAGMTPSICEQMASTMKETGFSIGHDGPIYALCNGDFHIDNFITMHNETKQMISEGY